MAGFTKQQIEVLRQRMPQILQALGRADDVNGFARTFASSSLQTARLPAQQAVARLAELDIAALIDALNDWCWCPEKHTGSCVVPQ